MDQTLVLLGSSAGVGGADQFSNETASSNLSVMEKNYMGFSSSSSETSSCSYSNDAELELGLGLSLCSGGMMAKGKKGCSWGGEYGRILTAKDFPIGFSGRRAAGSVSGTKRAASDSVSQPENGIFTSTGVTSQQVVGWPPIRAYRMNSLVNQSKIPNVEDDDNKGVGGNEKKELLENSKKKINCGKNNNHKNDDNVVVVVDDDDDDTTNTTLSLKEKKCHLGFIKVNVDGLPIGRKVDLNAHTCYESLSQALEDMFFKSTPTINSICVEKDQARQPPMLLDESSEFVLTYEDKEGDWMLVGDVPWGMFLSTVKRLRIMRRSSESNNGLAASVPQEKHERKKGKAI